MVVAGVPSFHHQLVNIVPNCSISRTVFTRIQWFIMLYQWHSMTLYNLSSFYILVSNSLAINWRIPVNQHFRSKAAMLTHKIITSLPVCRSILSQFLWLNSCSFRGSNPNSSWSPPLYNIISIIHWLETQHYPIIHYSLVKSEFWLEKKGKHMKSPWTQWTPHMFSWKRSSWNPRGICWAPSSAPMRLSWSWMRRRSKSKLSIFWSWLNHVKPFVNKQNIVI